MEDERNTGEGAAGTSRPMTARQRMAIAIAALVVLALVVFVPGPVFRVIHTEDAHRLVDEQAQMRAQLARVQDRVRAPLEGIGEPARSWTQVSCWLSERYSDGDGEQDVVMFYWQQCSLVGYELYPLPPEIDTGARAASLFGGSTAGDPTCAEILFDVLTPDYGASNADEYAASLWWIDPGGDPPADQPDRCRLPEPGGSDAARVASDVDEPLTASSYLLYTVSSPVRMVDVGCDHRWPWILSCAGEPEGFPAL